MHLKDVEKPRILEVRNILEVKGAKDPEIDAVAGELKDLRLPTIEGGKIGEWPSDDVVYYLSLRKRLQDSVEKFGDAPERKGAPQTTVAAISDSAEV